MTLMRPDELHEFRVEAADYDGNIQIVCMMCKTPETIIRTGVDNRDQSLSLMGILTDVGKHYAARHEDDNRMKRVQAELDRGRK